MAGLPAEAESAFNFADFVITRADGSPLQCGGTFAPGEALEVALAAPAGSLWLLEASQPGAFAGGSCGGRRHSASTAASLAAPASGELTLKAGFARGYGAVTIAEPCTITAEGSAAPTPATVAPSPAAAIYETDVLVVGAGLAGAAAAWAAKEEDPAATVTVLAASLADVTTAYSGGWLWLPNNILNDDGADPQDDFVAHASQIAYPFGGAPAWAEEGLRTFWTHAPDAMRSLQDAHVFNWTLQYDMEGQAFPDYYGSDSYPRNRLPRGRVLRASRDGAALAGAELLPALQAAAGADRTLEGYVADGVEERADGSVVVTASALGGGPGVVVEATRGVVFATGGKIRGLGAAKNNHGLEAEVVGTCASPDSKGAALDALEELPGVDVVGKGNSWMYEVDATGANTVWFLWYGQPGGDFFVVDRLGRRVYNEGLSYNQRGEFHVDRVVDDDGESTVRDAADSSQLFLIYGDAAKATYSYLIDSPDTVATNVSAAAADVEAASWFGYDALHADFGANLRATLDDFNAAAAGDGDDPMGRGVPGTTAYDSSIAWWQFAFAYLGTSPPDEVQGNPLTQPFANDGASTRLYVRPLNFGSIDTKMGPKADKDMKVVGTSKIYAAGNAAASPFGQTYAAPGNTLGFALVSGYVAGRAAAGRRENEISYEGFPKPVAAGYRKLPESGAHQVLHLAYHNDTENVVVARSYGGFPWEGVMPAPLAVACDAGDCAADLPEGLWIMGFEGAAEKPRAAASRFLGAASFGPSTAAIDDLIDHFGGDKRGWIEEQMALPATLHRDYFRKRATPLMTETCDAGEAGADETLGAKYSWWYNRNFDGQSGVEVRYDRRNGKGMVFTNIALDAEDQLRQRMAWALSHIYVVAVDGVGEANEEIEVWLKYYDIFVEHAFGNLRDVLRDVASSPMMAVYLTFLGSEQYQGGDAFPDENFAREFLQLFTIGLREMRDDGTFTGYETYDGDDILTGARAWTGFDVPKLRGGVEAFRNENFIDDLDLVASRRDPFPKSDLAGGYVGDGLPLCVDVSPTDAGAVFSYVGSSVDDAPVLDAENPLRAALCAADADGACAFPRTVTLAESLPATSFATKRVAVVEDRRRGATAVYEYAPPACVNLAWFENPEAAIWDDQYGLCADPRAPFWDATAALPREGACALGVQIASSGAVNVVHDNGGGGDGTACAARPDESDYRGTISVTKFGKTCQKWTSQVPHSHGRTPENYPDAGLGDHNYCRNPDGEPGAWCYSADGAETRWEFCAVPTCEVTPTAWWLDVDSNRLFRVPWEDGAFPTADVDDCGSDCLRQGVTCLCPATAVESAAFAAIPSRADALEALKIGSPVDPADHAAYSFYGEVDGVAAFSRSAGVDVDTIFVLDDAVGNKAYLKNVVATVQVAGGYSFRNAPHFVPFAGSPSKQAARFETEAFIDGVFEHPNVAPFVAKLLLQRFSTSNPSPRYVAAVVDAFRTGSYGGFGTGTYGDLAATLAAILLDREATSPALLADPTHGRLREPLLKVLHFMRAMELDSLDGREVELEGMDRKIGQMVHEAPSVFSYYLPDYAPQGAVARRGLVAPEAQVMEGARLIGLANGLYSLIRHGLSRCSRGFGGGTGACNRWPADGGLAYAPPVPDRTSQCSREVDQSDYRGSIAKTRSGLACQRWDSQKPHQHKHTPDAHPDSGLAGHNFCRQPKSGKNRARAWCFTTEKKTKWDYCEVPRCDASFTDAVDDLDVLLTEGRLSDHSRAVILDAVDKPMLGGPNARLQLAQRLFTLAPEFHATNAHEPVGARDDEVYSDPPTRKYKAVVLLFLNGGMDSYTMLAPTGDCAVAGDYVDYRGPIAEMPFEMSEYRSIAPGSDQPCDTFGVHPSLEKIHGLYENGDASFFANIGSLVEPLTLAEYRSGAKRTPPSIGAHDVQQRLAQTVVSDNMSAKGVLGRILSALADPKVRDDPLNAVGYSLNGLQKALEGSGHAEVIDLNADDGFSRLIDYDELKEEIGLLLQNESSSVFADTFAGLFGPAIRHAEEISGIFEGDDGMVTDFPNTGLGRRFEDVARIVTKRDALEHERAAFFVEIGGFDNHGTLDALPMRLEEIDDAVAAFTDEMKAQGIFEDVAIVTMSDFGRTLTWNGAGTDHGWGGHHFIVGGGLNGSTIHGRYPETLGPDGDLNYSPGRGRIIPSTPWESMWHPLAQFMGVREDELDFVIPNRGNFPDLLEIGDVFHVGPTAAPSPTPSHAPSISHAPTTSPTPAPTLKPTVSHAPTPAPTLAPTVSHAPSFVPTATFAPTEQHVCEGIPGVRAYEGGRLHCVELNGELVDFFPVKGGARTCRHTDENSCPAGFDLWVPRNIEHAKLGLDRFGYQSTGTVGVYRTENGCGGCQRVAMNSHDQRAWEALDADNVGFTSVAGEGAPWFMRNEPYSEPNGNYNAGCWLTTNFGEGWEEGVGFRLDDANCAHCSTDYVCSTNRVAGFGPSRAPTTSKPSSPPSAEPSARPTISPAPSAAPTTSEPSPSPTPEPSAEPTVSPIPTAIPTARPTLDDVCPEAGVFEYGEHTLHCFFVGGDPDEQDDDADGSIFGAEQAGFCVNEDNQDVNSGVVRLRGGNFKTAAEHLECLELCGAYAGATGCETIWGQGNRGCYVHTSHEIAKGNGQARHSCWLATGKFKAAAEGGAAEASAVKATPAPSPRELVDIVPIENGARTCKRTDENSCPPGMDIWVLRSVLWP